MILDNTIYVEGSIQHILIRSGCNLEELKKISYKANELINESTEKRFWEFPDVHYTFTIDDFQSIVNEIRLQIKMPVRIAFYAPHDLMYGNLRMLLSYISKDTRAQRKVFRDKEEAMTWLIED